MELEQALRWLRAEAETAASAMPDPTALFEGAVARMEQPFGDPELVDPASLFLRQIIWRIVLVPEAGAEHGLSVKLEADFTARLAPEIDGIPPAHLVC